MLFTVTAGPVVTEAKPLDRVAGPQFSQLAPNPTHATVLLTEMSATPILAVLYNALG